MFSMAGTRIGWIICRDREMYEVIKTRRSYNTICCGIFDELVGSIALENYEKAASMLVKAAEMSDSFSVSPIWLKQAGEIYEKMGKNEQAANVYRTIKDKYSSSMVARDIDKYIERATAIAK